MHVGFKHLSSGHTNYGIHPALLVNSALQTSYPAGWRQTQESVVQTCMTEYYDAMQQGPSLEGDSRAASQGITRLLLRTKCH